MQSLDVFTNCEVYMNYADKIFPYFTDIKNKSFSCIHRSRMDNDRSSYILYFIN